MMYYVIIVPSLVSAVLLWILEDRNLKDGRVNFSKRTQIFQLQSIYKTCLTVIFLKSTG